MLEFEIQRAKFAARYRYNPTFLFVAPCSAVGLALLSLAQWAHSEQDPDLILVFFLSFVILLKEFVFLLVGNVGVDDCFLRHNAIGLRLGQVL